ncbi:MAG: hypothetical protein LBM02_00745 [Lachnospiraceae bacterium]|jgi:hypothetical protein|nr:hypothetical protein [Lachnospiraceae bacterium]
MNNEDMQLEYNHRIREVENEMDRLISERRNMENTIGQMDSFYNSAFGQLAELNKKTIALGGTSALFTYEADEEKHQYMKRMFRQKYEELQYHYKREKMKLEEKRESLYRERKKYFD